MHNARSRPTACLLLCLAASGGCSVIGAAAYKLSPPVMVPAQYTPAKEPMLVVVERAANPGDPGTDAARIVQYVQERLDEKKVAPLVDARSVDFTDSPKPLRQVGDPPASERAAQSASPAAKAGGVASASAGAPFDPFKSGTPRYPGPAAQGRAAGAKQVLYVELTEFNIDPATGSDRVKGAAEARVRIVDAVTGEVRWPTDTSQGHTVAVTTSWVGLDSRSGDFPIRDQMSKDMAGRVARLFFKWRSEQVDEGSPQ